MVYLVISHAARTPGVAAGDVAEEELQIFARERRQHLVPHAARWCCFPLSSRLTALGVGLHPAVHPRTR
jgi:hypothetical protein